MPAGLVAAENVRAGDWTAAETALSAVGPTLVQLPRGNLLLAQVKTRVGQPEQAIEAAQRQVLHAPDDLAALTLLARLQLARRQADKAAEILASTPAAGHSGAETLALMSGIYARTGKPDLSLEALRQASALAPDDRPAARCSAT